MKDKALFIVLISLVVVLAGSFVGMKLFKDRCRKPHKASGHTG